MVLIGVRLTVTGVYNNFFKANILRWIGTNAIEFIFFVTVYFIRSIVISKTYVDTGTIRNGQLKFIVD